MLEIFKKLEKYNYWYGNKVNTGFIRNMYLNRIKKYSNNNLVKVLVGQRRVGKSYIMRQLIENLINSNVNPKNIFYLNKEIVDFDDVKTYLEVADLIEIYRKNVKPNGKVYVFLDEIQEISNWEKTVNSLSQDYKNQYEVFITGSNSNLLSGELATYLSGRTVSFEIFPFLFEEYCEYFNVLKNKENYLAYMKLGGLPELYKLQDEEVRTNYIGSLKNTILLKDVVERYKIKDAALLEDLFTFLKDNIGNLFSVQKIVKYLESNKRKTNYETLSNYINYLLNSFLFYQSDRFDLKGKAILSGSRKYYINDLSFRNYLSSSFDDGFGKHLENNLYIYFRSQGYKIYTGAIDGQEVDFILEKNGEKRYIQVAYLLTSKKVIEREIRSLQKIRDSYPKILISLDDFSFGNKEGISHLRPWEIGEVF